jgi:hypothetical protein
LEEKDLGHCEQVPGRVDVRGGDLETVDFERGLVHEGAAFEVHEVGTVVGCALGVDRHWGEFFACKNVFDSERDLVECPLLGFLRAAFDENPLHALGDFADEWQFFYLVLGQEPRGQPIGQQITFIKDCRMVADLDRGRSASLRFFVLLVTRQIVRAFVSFSYVSLKLDGQPEKKITLNPPNQIMTLQIPLMIVLKMKE